MLCKLAKINLRYVYFILYSIFKILIYFNRALAESLMLNGSVNSEATIEPDTTSSVADSSIIRAIELSQREEEERKRNREREEQELQEILALSLMEK